MTWFVLLTCAYKAQLRAPIPILMFETYFSPRTPWPWNFNNSSIHLFIDTRIFSCWQSLWCSELKVSCTIGNLGNRLKSCEYFLKPLCVPEGNFLHFCTQHWQSTEEPNTQRWTEEGLGRDVTDSILTSRPAGGHLFLCFYKTWLMM